MQYQCHTLQYLSVSHLACLWIYPLNSRLAYTLPDLNKLLKYSANFSDSLHPDRMHHQITMETAESAMDERKTNQKVQHLSTQVHQLAEGLAQLSQHLL